MSQVLTASLARLAYNYNVGRDLAIQVCCEPHLWRRSCVVHTNGWEADWLGTLTLKVITRHQTLVILVHLLPNKLTN